MLVAPAAAQTRNVYRDIFAAVLDYCVRQGWLPSNPLAEVKRRGLRADGHAGAEKIGSSPGRNPVTPESIGASARCSYALAPALQAVIPDLERQE
jgi:hypothetical protein